MSLASAGLTTLPGERIFDVRSSRTMDLWLGPDDTVTLPAEPLILRSETEFAEATIQALGKAFPEIPASQFRKHYFFSTLPETSLIRAAGARRRCMVGVQVRATVPKELGEELRRFYERELRSQTVSILQTAKAAITPEVVQQPDLFIDDKREHQASQASVSPSLASAPAISALPDGGTLARQELGRELGARFAGKAFSVSLPGESSTDLTTCGGQFERPQRRTDEGTRVTLHGQIISLSKDPPQLKIVTEEQRPQSNGHTWTVSCRDFEKRVEDLAALFVLTHPKAVQFDVLCFKEVSVQGESMRFELLSCGRLALGPGEAANEGAGSSECGSVHAQPVAA